MHIAVPLSEVSHTVEERAPTMVHKSFEQDDSCMDNLLNNLTKPDKSVRIAFDAEQRSEWDLDSRGVDASVQYLNKQCLRSTIS